MRWWIYKLGRPITPGVGVHPLVENDPVWPFAARVRELLVAHTGWDGNGRLFVGGVPSLDLHPVIGIPGGGSLEDVFLPYFLAFENEARSTAHGMSFHVERCSRIVSTSALPLPGGVCIDTADSFASLDPDDLPIKASPAYVNSRGDCDLVEIEDDMVLMEVRRALEAMAPERAAGVLAAIERRLRSVEGVVDEIDRVLRAEWPTEQGRVATALRFIERHREGRS